MEITKNNLLRYLTTGLVTHANQETESQLGDRSLYIGMSDIGKAMECIRSAVADKAGITRNLETFEIRNLSDTDLKKALIKQLTLQRGHWQEYGLEQTLIALDAQYIPQLEISLEYLSVPIKAHLDITLVQDKPHQAVRVLELKSNENIPGHLYASYEAQIYGQVGLLVYCWNLPCFSVPKTEKKGCLGNVTFPEIVQHLFGLEISADPSEVDIEAWVLSISMSDIKPFGPYFYDRAMLQACFDKGQEVWEKKEGILQGAILLNELSYCKGFHPLCDYCMVNRDCPKFISMNLATDNQYDLDFDELEKIKIEEKRLNRKRKDIEQRIKSTYSQLSLGNRRDWINSGSYRFKVSQMPGRASLDMDKLGVAVEGRIGGSQKVTDIVASCQKTNPSYERLYVSKINKH